MGVVLHTALVYWNLLSLVDCLGRAEALLEIYETELKDQRGNSGVSCALIGWQCAPGTACPPTPPAATSAEWEKVLKCNP